MSDSLVVVFQRRATREVETIDDWWRANRATAPDLFVVELERMLAAVALMPTLGAPAKSERLRDVRRVMLQKTRYHLYYRVRGNAVEVLAVWHAARGTGPGL
jgi:plasmid stabilization system protein ParE